MAGIGKTTERPRPSVNKHFCLRRQTACTPVIDGRIVEIRCIGCRKQLLLSGRIQLPAHFCQVAAARHLRGDCCLPICDARAAVGDVQTTLFRGAVTRTSSLENARPPLFGEIRPLSLELGGERKVNADIPSWRCAFSTSRDPSMAGIFELSQAQS